MTGPGKGWGQRSPSLPAVVAESHIPLRWQVIVDPAAVVLSLHQPGRPKPKLRARSSANGGTYTPKATREATEAWQWTYRLAMHGRPAEEGPLGMVVHFWLPDNRSSDDDNMEKLVKDAGNGIAWKDDKQFVQTHLFTLRNCTEQGTELLVWRLPGRGAR